MISLFARIAAGCLISCGLYVALSVRAPKPFDGLSLYAPLHSTDVQLRDNLHHVVHRWKCDLPPGQCTKMLPDGSLLRTARVENPAFEKVYGKGSGGGVQWINWDGTKRWDYRLSSDRELLHHDIELMPNGHILMLVWVKIPLGESQAHGCKTATADAPLISERIVEIDPNTNRTIWSWDAWDHVVQNVDPTLPDFGDPLTMPTRIDVNLQRDENDWLHFNALSYNAAQDLIIVSCRQTSELWIIDHSTTSEQAQTSHGGQRGVGGDIWLRWGNSSSTSRELYHQHNVHWIPEGLPGAGNILLFDNGDELSRPHSRVVELKFHPDREGEDAFEIVWDFIPKSGVFFSAFVSGVQRLPNGNTFVCSGTQGWVFEVSPKGSVIWQFRFDVQDRLDWLFRLEKYPRSYAHTS
ncbi:MAG: aryl-sulfate sulfotransferase [Planctomycetales bacterium]|nr:aryl-sulfate sulfotransferase [Planctomycetales bacterium]